MKVCIAVIDALGIGAAPDAEQYGDAGANTYVHTVEKTGVSLPNLAALGINNIDGVPFPRTSNPVGAYGRMQEQSPGKDTTTGHWEIAGLPLSHPFPTYPDGFPAEVIAEFERRIGTKTLFNGKASGTEIIQRLGAEHVKTGYPIVYTSADSVFQIAAHVDKIPLQRLYEISEIARELLSGEHSVARVIARPFETAENGAFRRTEDRRDFSVKPFAPTVLDQVKAAGLTTYAIGKIEDIFAGCGITKSLHTHNNTAGLEATFAALQETFDGLIFTNLVDTDMLYGHRRDADGYAAALLEIDGWIPKFRSVMKREDVLILTGDHGCDPTFKGTDHTREYVPLLLAGDGIVPLNLDTIRGFQWVASYVMKKFQIRE